MHQIRFRLELCPRPRWGAHGAHSALPNPLAGLKGPTSKGRKGGEGNGMKRKGREKKGGAGGEGRGTKGKGRK